MLKKLQITKFGPFKEYEILFPGEGECFLLTGKNNEGKSSIISSLKLLGLATKVVGKRKQMFTNDLGIYYKLLNQDIEGMQLNKLINNYTDDIAEIIGIFDEFSLNVYIDPNENQIYSSYAGRLPNDIDTLIGSLPSLGQLNEQEDLISNVSHLRASLNTSLAPRHLRNHFYHFLSYEDYELVKRIVNSSWKGIELHDWEHNYEKNKLYCYFSENRIDREISWAGQGFQVWLQIITHLVRLRNTSLLILDEPEINLHPEKQHDLIKVIRTFYRGTVVIATHSIELMNNVSVNHIIHIQKDAKRPVIKTTKDRQYLEFIRAEIGSNFNLVASQFENFDIVIFTEDKSDFDVISKIMRAYGIQDRAFNIPIFGFKQYRSCVHFKRAYDLLMGKNKVKFTLLLDRDYYPLDYLNSIIKELGDEGIKTVFTNGKEIENIYINESLLFNLLPFEKQDKLKRYIEEQFKELYYDCLGSYQKLHKEYYKSLDEKTIVKKYNPDFDMTWNDTVGRYNKIAGKEMLKRLRDFFQKEVQKTLTDDYLLDELLRVNRPDIESFIREIFQTSTSPLIS